MASIKLNPPIKDDLDDNGGRISFNTLHQIDKWISAELDAWEFLREILNNKINNHPYLSDACRKQLRHLDQLRQSLDQAKSNASSNSVSSDDLNSHLNPYRNRAAIHAKSQIGRFLINDFSECTQKIEYAESAGVLAAAIDAPFTFENLRSNPSQNIRPVLAGEARYRALTQRPTELRRAYTDKCDDLFDQWQDRFEEWETSMEATKNEIDQFNSESQKVSHKLSRRLDASKLLLNRSLRHGKRHLREFEDFYGEAVRTQAPITYWNNKASNHKIIAITLGVISILLIVSAIGGAYFIGDWLFTQATTTGVDTTDYLLGRVAIFIIPAFFSVWLIRIIVRVFFNNLASYNDAKERATMAETFISLLEHEEKMEPEDRIVMLQALFRSSPGAGLDEGAPPSWFDLAREKLTRS